jgi:hypothetical protein
VSVENKKLRQRDGRGSSIKEGEANDFCPYDSFCLIMI